MGGQNRCGERKASSYTRALKACLAFCCHSSSRVLARSTILKQTVLYNTTSLLHPSSNPHSSPPILLRPPLTPSIPSPPAHALTPHASPSAPPQVRGHHGRPRLPIHHPLGRRRLAHTVRTRPRPRTLPARVEGDACLRRPLGGVRCPWVDGEWDGYCWDGYYWDGYDWDSYYWECRRRWYEYEYTSNEARWHSTRQRRRRSVVCTTVYRCLHHCPVYRNPYYPP